MLLSKARPVSQVVKTSPSHGEGRGSTPLRVTIVILNKVPEKSSFLGALPFQGIFLDSEIQHEQTVSPKGDAVFFVQASHVPGDIIILYMNQILYYVLLTKLKYVFNLH